MRAGYAVVALAAIVVILLVAVASPADEASGATSPLATALGLDGPDPPGLTDRQALAVARLTAACMARLGWRYLPDPEPAPVIPDPALPPIAWADRWGFGVSMAIGLEPPNPMPDRNAAHAATLPPEARSRYLDALHGSGSQPGCHTGAVEAVHGVRARALAPMHRDLANLASTIAADPSLGDVRSRWVGCARDATQGLGLVASDLDRGRIAGRLLDIFAAQASAASTPTQLVDVRARERRVAGAVARCESAFAADYARVAIPHELRFVRDHRDTLAAARSALRAAEAALPTVPP